MARRITHSIDDNQVLLLCRALDEADRINRLPNLLVTVNWQEGGVSDPSRANTKLWKKVGTWLRYYHEQLVLIWSLEAPNEFDIHGHYLIFVPDHLRTKFRRFLVNWLRSLGFRIDAARQRIDVTPISRSGNGAESGKACAGTLIYMLKGSSSPLAGRLQIQPKKMGTIRGKRVGVSEYIGPSTQAIRRAGFDEMTIDEAMLVVRSSPLFCKVSSMDICYDILFSRQQQERIAQRPRQRDSWGLVRRH